MKAAEESSLVRIVLPPVDQERVESIVEALRVRGTHGKHGEEVDAYGVLRLAVLLVFRMTLEEVARLYDNVPIGPIVVWNAKPPPRTARPGGDA